MTKKIIEAITKKQAEENSLADLVSINNYTSSINSSLRTGNRDFLVSKLGNNEVVRKHVIQKFEKSGWNLKLHLDQRDGNYYKFS